MKKILFSFLIVASFTGFSQKVSNKLSFQKGQKLEVTTNMNMSSQMMMGETSGSTLNTEVYEVKDAAASNTTLEKAIKNVRFSFSVMGQEKTFDSDKKEDLNSDLGQSIKPSIDTHQEFTVDANGRIISVKEDPTKKKKEQKSGDMMSMFMSQFNVGSAPPKAGDASLFHILPDHEVGKGDSWTDTTGINGNPFKTVYTVKDITSSEVLLDFTGDGKINTKQEMMGMSLEVKGTVAATGTVTLDKTTGLLKQKTSTSTTETSTSVSGQDMTATTKMTTVTTVKPS